MNEFEERIARLLADERDLAWSHHGIRYRLMSEAGELIDQWRRHPKPSPSDDIESICAEATEQERQHAAARAARVAIRQDILTELRPEPEADPDWIKVTVQDAKTMKVWELTVPATNARLVLDRRTASGKDLNLIHER